MKRVKLSLVTQPPGDMAKKARGQLFMVFPYMDHDLAGLLENPMVKLQPQHIKSYIKQLLEGLDYMHKVCRRSHLILRKTYCIET